MPTITLHLPDPVPLAALKAFAEAVNCTLRYSFRHGYTLHHRAPFGEHGLILNIADDLCAAWAAGGEHARYYLDEAFRMAASMGDLESARDLNDLRTLLILRDGKVRAA